MLGQTWQRRPLDNNAGVISEMGMSQESLLVRGQFGRHSNEGRVPIALASIRRTAPANPGKGEILLFVRENSWPFHTNHSLWILLSLELGA